MLLKTCQKVVHRNFDERNLFGSGFVGHILIPVIYHVHENVKSRLLFGYHNCTDDIFSILFPPSDLHVKGERITIFAGLGNLLCQKLMRHE